MRLRFNPPVGNFADPAFVLLFLQAASTDCNDRQPSAGDIAYWTPMIPGLNARGLEINHPNYAWDRLIGWQAGPADAPKYGPYAQPPNVGPPLGWTNAFVDTTAAPVVVPPVDPDQGDTLFTLIAKIDALAFKVDALLATRLVFPEYSGKVWGAPITLKPSNKS